MDKPISDHSVKSILAQNTPAYLTRVCELLLIVGELSALMMVFHIVLDVFLRSAFSAPLEGTIETVAEWYMVALIFMPLANVQLRGGHIRAEVFNKLLSAKMAVVLELFALLLICAVGLLLGYFAVQEALHAFSIGSRVELTHYTLPIWPAYWFVPIGFFAMVFVAALQFLSLFTNGLLRMPFSQGRR